MDGMLATNAVQVLEQAASDATKRPFFVAVGVHRPHLPWNVPQKYFDLYPPGSIKLADHNKPPLHYGAARNWSWDPQSGPRHCGVLRNMTHPNVTLPEFGLVPDALALQFRRAYYASVSFMDHNIGTVLSALTRLGFDQNTIVLFIGDHGWQLGDLGEFGKKTNFERATRAPLLIRTPPAAAGSTAAAIAAQPAASSDALVEFVDIMPTLIDLAGLPVPTLCPVNSRNVTLCREGTSLKSVLKAPAASSDFKDAVFMQYAHCMHDEMVWHDGCNDPTEPKVMGYAVRTRRWRYIEWVPFDKNPFPPQPKWDGVLGRELYDHTDNDSVENAAEATNLADQDGMADVVAKLSKKLRAGWRNALPLNAL